MYFKVIISYFYKNQYMHGMTINKETTAKCILPPSRFQRATSLREGGSYVPFREGVNILGAC